MPTQDRPEKPDANEVCTATTRSAARARNPSKHGKCRGRTAVTASTRPSRRETTRLSALPAVDDTGVVDGLGRGERGDVDRQPAHPTVTRPHHDRRTCLPRRRPAGDAPVSVPPPVASPGAVDGGGGEGVGPGSSAGVERRQRR